MPFSIRHEADRTKNIKTCENESQAIPPHSVDRHAVNITAGFRKESDAHWRNSIRHDVQQKWCNSKETPSVSFKNFADIVFSITTGISQRRCDSHRKPEVNTKHEKLQIHNNGHRCDAVFSGKSHCSAIKRNGSNGDGYLINKF